MQRSGVNIWNWNLIIVRIGAGFVVDYPTWVSIDWTNLLLVKKQNLAEVLKVLKEVLQINENSPINVLNYVKRLEFFPNACIAFRILLTILVTVAFAERSFSKLKLIKSYLRSTMSQERLSGLMTCIIECNLSLLNFKL